MVWRRSRKGKNGATIAEHDAFFHRLLVKKGEVGDVDTLEVLYVENIRNSEAKFSIIIFQLLMFFGILHIQKFLGPRNKT